MLPVREKDLSQNTPEKWGVGNREWGEIAPIYASEFHKCTLALTRAAGERVFLG